MKLTDILPIDRWEELEKDINARSGLNASVFDTEGTRITAFKKWANRLCPVIKADPKGATFICAMAHQDVAAEAAQTRQPVIGECDAGFAKLVVPIFVDDEFLGVVGGCGLRLDGNAVDSFLISKTTDIPEEKAAELASDAGEITKADADSLLAYIKESIDTIVKEFKAGRS